MDNLIDVLGLAKEIDNFNLSVNSTNFELIYDEIENTPRLQKAKEGIQKAVHSYFTSLV